MNATEEVESLMSRRQFLIGPALISALVIHLNSASVVAGMEKERPPNVILLLVDDMGYGDIAAHGNPIIKTPNFDALHDGSARFTNFAVSPSCAPTRAALMTGKHEFLSSVTHTIKPMREMNLKSTTIAQLFQKKGYRTGIFGKWHLQLAGPYNPGRRGFDEVLTCIDDNYKKSHFNPTLVKNGTQTKYQGYRTDIFFAESIRFIERNKDRPFFLYLATHSPHSPHKVPGRYSKRCGDSPRDSAGPQSASPETEEGRPNSNASCRLGCFVGTRARERPVPRKRYQTLQEGRQEK